MALCGDCRQQVSLTAGTIFQDTRTPLTVWFAAAWHLTTQRNGISALGLKRVLGLGSYQTAWAMLHRYRTAMVRPGRERLSGDVEVDESLFGGVKPGKRGRGAAGKVLVAIAVEQRSPKGYGRARMQLIPDATSVTLREFLQANVEPGAVVITDGLGSYPALPVVRTTRTSRSTSGRRGCRRTCRCPVFTGSPRSPSGGFSVLTRARWRPTTCRRTSTSSASGSTGATRGPAACFSTGSCSFPPVPLQSSTDSWWRTRGQSVCPQPRQPALGSDPAVWRSRRLGAPGGTSARWTEADASGVWGRDMDTPQLFCGAERPLW